MITRRGIAYRGGRRRGLQGEEEHTQEKEEGDHKERKSIQRKTGITRRGRAYRGGRRRGS